MIGWCPDNRRENGMGEREGWRRRIRHRKNDGKMAKKVSQGGVKTQSGGVTSEQRRRRCCDGRTKRSATEAVLVGAEERINVALLNVVMST